MLTACDEAHPAAGGHFDPPTAGLLELIVVKSCEMEARTTVLSLRSRFGFLFALQAGTLVRYLFWQFKLEFDFIFLA
jgi:hypothetical protein